MAGGGYYLLDGDLEQALVRVPVVRESSFAFRVAQGYSSCPKRSSTRRISWAKQAYNRNVESSGEMQRPGIAANEQIGRAHV